MDGDEEEPKKWVPSCKLLVNIVHKSNIAIGWQGVCMVVHSVSAKIGIAACGRDPQSLCEKVMQALQHEVCHDLPDPSCRGCGAAM